MTNVQAPMTNEGIATFSLVIGACSLVIPSFASTHHRQKTKYLPNETKARRLHGRYWL